LKFGEVLKVRKVLYVNGGLPLEGAVDALNIALEKGGFRDVEVVSAENSDEGLQIWEIHKAEIAVIVGDVFCDLDEIHKLVNHIRAHDHDTPILMVTRDPKYWVERQPELAERVRFYQCACPRVVEIMQEERGGTGNVRVSRRANLGQQLG
jgi:hypothetical protein